MASSLKELEELVARLKREGSDAPGTEGSTPTAIESESALDEIDRIQSMREARYRAAGRGGASGENKLMDDIMAVKSGEERQGVAVGAQLREGTKDLARSAVTGYASMMQLGEMRNIATDNLEKERAKPFSTFNQATGEQAHYVDWLREQGIDPVEMKNWDAEKKADSRVQYKLTKGTEYIERMKGVREYIQDKLKADPAYLETTGFLEDFVRMGPTVGAQILAGLAAGGIGAGALMFASIAGGKVQELMDQGVPFETAATAAAWDATFQTPLEALSLGAATKFLKGRGTIKSLLGKAVEIYGKEFITEYAQAYPAAATEIWGKNPDADKMELVIKFLEKVTDPEFHKQAAKEGLIATAWAGVATAPRMGKLVHEAKVEGVSDDKKTKAAPPGVSDAALIDEADEGTFIIKPDSVSENAKFADEMGEPEYVKDVAPAGSRSEVDNLLGVESADSIEPDKSAEIPDAGEGVSLSPDLVNTPEMAKEQLQTNESVDAVLRGMATDNYMDTRRKRVLEGQAKIQQLEEDFSKALDATDHEVAMDIATEYANVAQGISDNVDEFLIQKQEKLTSENATLDENELIDLGSYTEGLLQRAQDLVVSQENAIKIAKAKSNMAQVEAMQDPAVFRQSLVEQEEQAGRNDEKSKKMYRTISDMNDTRDIVKNQYFFEKVATEKTLIQLQGDLRRKIKAEASDRNVSEDTKRTDAAALEWVEKTIGEKIEYDTAKDTENAQLENIKLQQERAKLLTSSDPNVRKERAEVATKKVAETEAARKKEDVKKQERETGEKASLLEQRRAEVRKQQAQVRGPVAEPVSDERRAEIEASRERARARKEQAKVAEELDKPQVKQDAKLKAQEARAKSLLSKVQSDLRVQAKKNYDAAVQKSAAARAGSLSVREQDKLIEQAKKDAIEQARKEALDKPKATPVPTERKSEIAASKARRAAVKAQEKLGEDLDAKPKKTVPTKAKVADLKKPTATFAILTSDNPQSAKATSSLTNTRNRVRLAKDLKDMGIDFETGESNFAGNKEMPFILKDVTREQAKTLSDKYDQASFIFGEGAYVDYVADGKVRRAKKSDIRIAPNAKGDYTVLNGEKFSIPFPTDSTLDIDKAQYQISDDEVQAAKSMYRSAAIRYKGKVYEGPSHASTMMMHPSLADAVLDTPSYLMHATFEHGFVRHDGTFTDRMTASNELGLGKGTYLRSEDMLEPMVDAKAEAVQKQYNIEIPGFEGLTLKNKMGTLEVADALVKEMESGKYKWLFDKTKGLGVETVMITQPGQYAKQETVKRYYNNMRALENAVNRFEGALRPNPKTGEMTQAGGVKGIYIKADPMKGNKGGKAFINVPVIAARQKTIGKAMETVVHEHIHGLVDHAVRDMDKQQADAFNKELQEVWDSIPKEFIKETLESPDTHVRIGAGIIQVQRDGVGELITYAMAHPEFAAWLDKIPASPRFKAQSKGIQTLWDKLVNMITKVLGVPSKLTEVQDILNRHIKLGNDAVRFSKEAVMPVSHSEYAQKWAKDKGFDIVNRTQDPMDEMWGVFRHDLANKAWEDGIELDVEEYKDALHVHQLTIPKGKENVGVKYLRQLVRESRTLNKPISAQVVNKGLLDGLIKKAKSMKEDKENYISEFRFSLKDISFDFGANVSVSNVQSWNDGLTTAASKALPSTVVQSVADAEKEIGYNLPANAEAVWIPEHVITDTVHTGKKTPKKVKTTVPGRVLFIADNIQSKDHFIKKWLHEQVGHQGLRTLFGENEVLLNRFLDQCYRLFAVTDPKTLNEVIELYDIGKVDSKGKRSLKATDKLRAAEEVIARRAEKLKPTAKRGMIKRFKDFINRWLPKSFIGKINTFKLTDADVESILEMAKVTVITGDTRFGDMLSKALEQRRPRVKFKGWKTLPNFMFTDAEYKKWIREVEEAAPDIRKWYDKHQDALRATFGKDADLFNILLSVTSPNADVNTNVIFAAQTYAYLMGKAEKPGALYVNKLKARIDEEWTSPEAMLRNLESNLFKVTEFSRGLMGDPDATVGDMWMYRAFFGDHAVHGTASESYSAVKSVALRQKLHDLAAQMSAETGRTYTPREVQAAIWVHINAKSTGVSFTEIADYQSGFNKPANAFDGKTPLQWLQDMFPNLSDGLLSEVVGFSDVPMAPISPLAKQRILQLRREMKERGKKIDKYIVDADGTISTSFDSIDDAILNMTDAIVAGGRRVTVPEDAADWYREVFGFREVSTDNGETSMVLPDEVVGLYTSPVYNKVTEKYVRDNLGGYSGTYTQEMRFSLAARENLDKIKSMSQDAINERDRELLRTGNDGQSLLGKIHEWRDQSSQNINRLTTLLEQDFLSKFGGRKVIGPARAVGSGRLLHTADTELLNKAMNLYLDSGTGPNRAKVDAYVNKLAKMGMNKLTARQKEHLEIIDRMNNMSDEEITWATNNIGSRYESFFEFAKENNIIDSHVDNYVKRQWKLPDEWKDADIIWNGTGTSGFQLTTSSGKKRSIDSIVDGWDRGLDLRGEGALQNMQEYSNEIGYVYANRRFTEYMRGLINFSSGALMMEVNQKTNPGFKPPPGYSQIMDRGFVKPFHKLYARSDIAGEINKLGNRPSHQIWDTPLLRGVRRINSMLKSTILSVSLFHHFAGIRSYLFGVSGKKKGQWNPVKAYREGLSKLENQTTLVDPRYNHLGPVADLLIREGLTVGRTQDWDQMAIQDSVLEEVLKDTRGNAASLALKGWQSARRFKRSLTTGLFGRLFAGLKVEAGSIELVHKLEKAEQKKGSALDDAEIKQIAGQVASLVNADFGGLHLSRMGRNPDLQRMAQMFLLAPDWTESNWRTVTGALGLNKVINKALADNPEVKGMEDVYRKFWAGVAIRGVASVALAQAFMYAMSSDDEREDYLDFLKENLLSMEKFGKGRWASLDVTSAVNYIRDTTGISLGDPEKRQVVSVLGHFKDILKLADPRSLIKHKISPVAGTFESFWSGEDWKGSRFTSVKEAIEADGLLPKLTADNKFSDDLSGLSVWSQLPVIVGYRLRQSMPIFASELWTAASGESSVFPAVARMAGLDYRDFSHRPTSMNAYERARGEINKLDRELEEAKATKDRKLIRDAEQAIKEYKGYSKIKSQVGYARKQLSEVNKSIKALEKKRDEGSRFSALDTRRLATLKIRKEKIYEKFEKVIKR